MGKRLYTDEERRARDRASWARSRAKTGNWSSRAYNLAIQDAARWVRENLPSKWEEMYEARVLEQKARVAGAVEVGEVTCTHDELEVVPDVVVLRCANPKCYQFMGAAHENTPPPGYQVFTGDGGRVAYQRVPTS